MVVGDDVAVGRNDEAGTQRLRFLRARLTLLCAALPEKLTEQTGHGVAFHLHGLLRGNVDHGRLQLLGQIGKAHRRAAGGKRAHDMIFILRGLGGDGRSVHQGDGAAAEKKRCGKSIGIAHVGMSSQNVILVKKLGSDAPGEGGTDAPSTLNMD